MVRTKAHALRRLQSGGLQIGFCAVRALAVSAPPCSQLSFRCVALTKHTYTAELTLGGSGPNCEAISVPAQFKIRTIEASVHVRRGGCGKKLIAALTRLELIADCTVGTSHCNDPR
eukprot:5963523-Alexandrium_andersonii.AAC.1